MLNILNTFPSPIGFSICIKLSAPKTSIYLRVGTPAFFDSSGPFLLLPLFLSSLAATSVVQECIHSRHDFYSNSLVG